MIDAHLEILIFLKHWDRFLIFQVIPVDIHLAKGHFFRLVYVLVYEEGWLWDLFTLDLRYFTPRLKEFFHGFILFVSTGY